MPPLICVEGYEAGSDVSARYGLKAGWRNTRRIEVDSVIGACMAFRRDAVRAVGGFDAGMGRLNSSAAGEDLEFCRRFRRSGRRIWLAPQVPVMHLPAISGGCEARNGWSAGSALPHLRAMTYVILKEEHAFRRLNSRAFLRLLRANVARRDVLNKGPIHAFKALRQMSDLVREVRLFARTQRQDS